jgi:hypothetical protein
MYALSAAILLGAGAATAAIILSPPTTHSRAPSTAPKLDLTGVRALVWAQPPNLSTSTPCDPSINFDLGCNSFWLRSDGWSTYLSTRATSWPLAKSAGFTTTIIYFNAFLADATHAGLALSRLAVVLADAVAMGPRRTLLFVGRPDFYGSGLPSQTHDPVNNITARKYLNARFADILATPGVRGSVASSVYWMGAYCDAQANLCSQADVRALTISLRATSNGMGVPYLQHLDGPFWDKCWPQPCSAALWNYGGYSPLSLNGSADGLFAESWLMGSLRGGVEFLYSLGVVQNTSLLLLDDTPNCDMEPSHPCSSGSLSGDVSGWAATRRSLQLSSWGVWNGVDGGRADPNFYGDVANNGSALTAKGRLHAQIID